jgi:hypothetical protein
MSNIENMSQPEREVSELLDQLGIWWKYEYPLFVYDDVERPRIWTPDFYLPVLGIFVEVCGVDREDYDYREGVYDKNVCRVIFVHHYKERERWKSFLVQRLFDMQVKRLRETGLAIRRAQEMGIEFKISI